MQRNLEFSKCISLATVQSASKSNFPTLPVGQTSGFFTFCLRSKDLNSFLADEL